MKKETLFIIVAALVLIVVGLVLNAALKPQNKHLTIQGGGWVITTK